jgi:5'-nucleotidase
MKASRHLRTGSWLAVASLAAVVVACGGDNDVPAGPSEPVNLRLLAFNDFHGNLEPTGLTLNLPDPANASATVRVNTGGAAFLAAKLAELRAGQTHTITLSTGDAIGASPLISSFFREEPAIEVMNAMKVDLNVVGNHEFDKGLAELQRLVNGGCSSDTSDPNLTSCAVAGSRYAGSQFASGEGRGFLAANVVDAAGRPVLPPTAIRNVGGYRVGFIGVVTRTTPTIVLPSGVAGLRFLDEAETINRYTDELVAQGVRAIVALVHEGGQTDSSWNDRACANARGELFTIVGKLREEVDVVFSGHTHQGYNCVVNNKVVMQAFAFGRGISQVDLVLDPRTQDFDRSRTAARNVPVVNTTNTAAVTAQFPPVQADATVARIVGDYAALSAPKANRVIGRIASAVTRTPEASSGGDHPAGRLIADSQLAATRPTDRGGAQIAFMNPGGVRADFPCAAGPCDLTFGQAFTVQPFGNSLVVMTLTGAQLKALLEQQATGVNATSPRILQPSVGFTYTWTRANADNNRVSNLRLNGTAIDPATNYRVTVNSFLADGGDGFTVLTQGGSRLGGAQDIDALIAFLTASPTPVAPVTVSRITRG